MSLYDFDPNVFKLGKLCQRNHEYQDSGKSLRYVCQGSCVECRKIYLCDYYEKNKDHIAEQQKEYVQRKPEVARAAKQKYKQVHKDKVKQQAREYWKRKVDQGWTPSAEKRQQARERAKLWYRNNLERHQAYSRAWRRSDKGRLLKKVYGNRYRTKKLTNHNNVYSQQDLINLRAKFDNCCAYCGSNDAIAIDHFIPISKGGADVLGNLIPSCTSCNCSKKSSDAKSWYKTQPFYSATKWKRIVQHLGLEVVNGQIPLF